MTAAWLFIAAVPFMAAAGVVHAPAAIILYFKHARHEGKY